MNKLVAFCCLALAIVLVSPANATPETSIEIKDEAFGLSEDEVFVLRTVFDNMGSYYEHRFETFLIAISLTTGEQTSWHVSSASVTTQFGDEGEDDTQKLEYLPAAQRSDPFAILAQRQGVLWQTHSRTPWQGDPKPQETEAASVQFGYPGLAVFALNKQTAQAHRDKSVRQVAADIPEYSRHSQMDTRGIVLERLAFERTCEYSYASAGTTPLTLQPVYLVRMTCSGEDNWEPTSLLVLGKEVLVSEKPTE